MTDDEKRERRRAYQREYQREYRKTHDRNAYKREWMIRRTACGKGRRDEIVAWHKAFLARHGATDK